MPEDIIQPSPDGASANIGDPAPSAAAAIEAPDEQREGILEEMRALRRAFENKISYDETKDRQLQVMHAELQTYRDGLHFQLLRPIFLDLIALYDDLSKSVTENETAAPPVAQASKIVSDLRFFQETLEDILHKNGVECVTDASSVLMANRQKIVKVIPIADQALDRTIARSVRKGFAYEGRTLRPEWVEVYRYTEQSEPEKKEGEQDE